MGEALQQQSKSASKSAAGWQASESNYAGYHSAAHQSSRAAQERVVEEERRKSEQDRPLIFGAGTQRVLLWLSQKWPLFLGIICVVYLLRPRYEALSPITITHDKWGRAFVSQEKGGRSIRIPRLDKEE